MSIRARIVDARGWEGNWVCLEVIERLLGWEEEDFQSYYVGGPDHGLDMEGWPAVGGHADQLLNISFNSYYTDSKQGTNLDLFRDLVQIHITPAGVRPVWDEWASDTRIQENKPLV